MDSQNPESFTDKHPLNDDWTWWFTNPPRQQTRESWGDNLKEIYTFGTVEDFWSLWNNIKAAHELPQECTYHLFKKGIEPKWEDAENKHGGQWVYLHDKRASTQNSNEVWLHVILAIIGNSFDDSEDICGVQIKVKRAQDKICLWTKSGHDEQKQRRIGEHFKQVLETDRKVEYNIHEKTTYIRL